MTLKSIVIPFDTYERNKKIAGFLKKRQTVLDVGGGSLGLKLFVNNQVTTLDPDNGQIKKDLMSANIKNDSYDVVTCVDVLEHVPPKYRSAFVKKLEEIAKDTIIISAPYGSKGHIDAEKRLIKKIEKKEIKVDFLKEHVANGLPKPQVVLENIKSKKYKVFYSGNYKISNFLFLVHLYETGFGPIDRMLLHFKTAVNIFFNVVVYRFWFYKEEKESANRFYVIINK